jgi:TolB-like protein/Flp pilus assembly protein TadD
VVSDKPGLFEELKRRHVWRVAVAYAIAAWLLVQIATQVFPFFNIPNWAVRLVVLLLAIGFVVAVVFAWIFELTPEGIRRTAPADSPEARETHTTRAVGRKLNAVIITVLVLAVLLLLGNQFLWHKGMRASPIAAAPMAKPLQASVARTASSPAVETASPLPASTAAIPGKSVAVLPFVNEGEKSEQFFSDGLSEDLITALSQFAGLKVISRNSAFQFRDSKDSSAEIGTLLGVAHLLEGSVQRAGDEVRITATLVNAADGTVVWTQRYDKPYEDLFALQDDITHSVADALKAKLLTAPGAVVQSDRPPSGSLDAYAAYQHGLAYVALGTEASHHQAIDAINEAIRLDPDYAAAYAELSVAWAGLAGEFMADPTRIAQAWSNARKASATALALNPDSAQAHLARENLLVRVDFDWAGAEAECRRALQLAPNNAQAQFSLGHVLATLGQNRQAVALTRKALATDPRHASWYSWLSTYLAALGQLDVAQQAIATAIALQPGAVDQHEQLAVVAILRGDAKAALASAQQEPPGPWHTIAMALARQIGPDRAAADAALETLITHQADTAPYQVAEVYALRRDPDSMFQWLDRAWTNRDSGTHQLLSDPLILRYRDDPRFAAFCKKVGLPTTTDAVAMK